MPADYDAAVDVRVRRGSVLTSAAIGAALTPLNSTMVAVALPALSAEFGAPAASVTVFVVTGYLVATLVLQMPAGSIADRLGYARAVIPWTDAFDFYRKCSGAEPAHRFIAFAKPQP